MTAIQRIRWPAGEETRRLYVRPIGASGREPRIADGELFLRQGEGVSLDTYFNSCFAGGFGGAGRLRAVCFRFRVRGEFQVRVYGSRGGPTGACVAEWSGVSDGAEHIVLPPVAIPCDGSETLRLEAPVAQRGNGAGS